MRIVVRAYNMLAPLFLMLLWFGLFDCGLGADWLAELPGKWRFGLGLGLWLGSWVLAVVLLYWLNRLCKVGGSFWLENLAGLAVCYGVVEGCQQLWQLNLASLAGQNELMPANQLVVLMWCFLVLVQGVVRIALRSAPAER